MYSIAEGVLDKYGPRASVRARGCALRIWRLRFKSVDETKSRTTNLMRTSVTVLLDSDIMSSGSGIFPALGFVQKSAPRLLPAFEAMRFVV